MKTSVSGQSCLSLSSKHYIWAVPYTSTGYLIDGYKRKGILVTERKQDTIDNHTAAYYKPHL